jgi:hypothetical protein
MRLPTIISIGLAVFGAAGLCSPALAQAGYPHGDRMPPPDMPMDHRDMPPPPGYPGPGPYPGHDGPDGPWAYPGGPMPGHWMPPCAEHHEPHGSPACAPYPYYPGYPAMAYAVPMMMVPGLRQKPCPEEVVEEWIEEPAPARRRYIPPRAKDKRVKVAPTPDKRVPDKRIPY